jgi:hypothetical protein
MLIPNLITPIEIFEEKYGVVFDLGLSNDEQGILFSEVNIKKIYDPNLKEYFDIEQFYGKKTKKLNELKELLEKGIDKTLLVEDFESFDEFTKKVLPRYNILMKRPKLQEKTKNKIICDKVCDILKHNGDDINNLVNSLLGGVEDAFEKSFGDNASKYMDKFYKSLSRKLPNQE